VWQRWSYLLIGGWPRSWSNRFCRLIWVPPVSRNWRPGSPPFSTGAVTPVGVRPGKRPCVRLRNHTLISADQWLHSRFTRSRLPRQFRRAPPTSTDLRQCGFLSRFHFFTVPPRAPKSKNPAKDVGLNPVIRRIPAWFSLYIDPDARFYPRGRKNPTGYIRPILQRNRITAIFYACSRRKSAEFFPIEQ